MMHVVFVYGSLKNGFHNHHILDDSTFLSAATTAAEFSMFSMGSYPGVTKFGTTRIEGELYYVDDDTLKRLDRLEGHPNFYRREKIEVVGDGESRTVVKDVWIYLVNPKYVDGRNKLPNGKWVV